MAVKMEGIKTDGASCTLWLMDTPHFEDRKTATIGNFQAENIEAGERLIKQAILYLQEHCFDFVLGPMNGNTWQSYRFVTGSDGSPPFLMEPQNPDFYPDVFMNAGFEAVGEYSSAKVMLTGHYEEKSPPEGIHLRPFDTANAKGELHKIWELSLEAFAKNYLYTPIEKAEFMALYEPVLDYLIPDFVLMAETEDATLKGFLFAVPDYNQGKQPDQLIVKTYASLQRGIGGALLDLIHKKAEESGFKTVIHALMYDSNVSKKHSDKFSETFRRYTLYGREIKV